MHHIVTRNLNQSFSDLSLTSHST